MIGELQLDEQALNVVEHLLIGSVGVLRSVDAYNLYLVELMQSVQAAHVLAIAASLTTEAS